MKNAMIKKLSIAMASALVVASLSPASVSAAKKEMTMNKVAKTLYVNDDNKANIATTYDFNIKNKPTNTKKTKYVYDWYAEDESIVKVEKGGIVTALKAGQTVVKCDVSTKKGKYYGTVEATVTVKANAKTVTITNLPENNTMGIGAINAHDFNRKATDAKGNAMTDKTEWVLTADAEGKEALSADIATVDKKGIVTANQAGEFYLTAKTYQSAATKADPTAVSETIKITAKAQLTDEVKNISADEIVFKYDADMSKVITKDNIEVANANGVKQVVKSVSFSADGKTVTAKMFNALVDKVTYKVTINGAEESFTASIGAVASVVITGPTLVADGEAAKLECELYDANGVKVSKANGTFVEFKSDSTGCWVDNSDEKRPTITIFQIGTVAAVKAIYHTQTYDLTNGTENVIESALFNVTCVDSVAATLVNTPVITLSDKKDAKGADFSKINTTTAVGDPDLYINVKFALSDKPSDAQYSDASKDDNWTFESTNPSTVMVDPFTGLITAVKEGSAIVNVKYNGTVVTTTTIVVRAERKAVKAVVADSSNSVTLSNSGTVHDTVTFDIKLKDQYGDDYKNDGTDGTALSVTPTGTADQIKNAPAVKYSTENPRAFYIDAADATKGTYTYKATRAGKDVYVVVNIVEANSAVNYVKVKPTATSRDMKLADKTDYTSFNFDVNLVSVATNGIEKDVVTNGVAGKNITYTVKNTTTGDEYYVGKPGTPEFVTEDGNGKLTIKPVIVDVATNTYVKMPTGTYVITAKCGGDSYVTLADQKVPNKDEGKRNIQTGTFTLTDSQTTTTVYVDKVRKEFNLSEGVLTESNIKEKLLDCFKRADSVEKDFEITEVVLGTKDMSNKGTYSVLVKKITITEYINGIKLNTVVDVNTVIECVVK